MKKSPTQEAPEPVATTARAMEGGLVQATPDRPNPLDTIVGIINQIDPRLADLQKLKEDAVSLMARVEGGEDASADTKAAGDLIQLETLAMGFSIRPL